MAILPEPSWRARWVSMMLLAVVLSASSLGWISERWLGVVTGLAAIFLLAIALIDIVNSWGALRGSE